MDINIDKEHGYVFWHNGDNTVTRKVRRIERACYHEDDNYVEVSQLIFRQVFIRNICLRWILELRLLLKQMRLTNMADTDGTIQ